MTLISESSINLYSSSSQLFAEQQSVGAFWRAARRIITTKNQKSHRFRRKISTLI